MRTRDGAGITSPTGTAKTVQFDDVPPGSDRDSIPPAYDSPTRERHSPSNEDNHHHHRQRRSGNRSDPATSSQPSKRSQPSRSEGQYEKSDSEDTVELPDRFDENGQLKNSSNGSNGRARSGSLGNRIENVLNGRAASNLLRKVFE